MRIGIVAIALVLTGVATPIAQGWAGEDCGDGDEFSQISLSQFWEEMVANEPAIEAGQAELRAARADEVV